MAFSVYSCGLIIHVVNSLRMEPVCCTNGRGPISDLMHSNVDYQCEASVWEACLAHLAGPLGYAAGRSGADAEVHERYRPLGPLGLSLRNRFRTPARSESRRASSWKDQPEGEGGMLDGCNTGCSLGVLSRRRFRTPARDKSHRYLSHKGLWSADRHRDLSQAAEGTEAVLDEWLVLLSSSSDGEQVQQQVPFIDGMVLPAVAGRMAAVKDALQAAFEDQEARKVAREARIAAKAAAGEGEAMAVE